MAFCHLLFSLLYIPLLYKFRTLFLSMPPWLAEGTFQFFRRAELVFPPSSPATISLFSAARKNSFFNRSLLQRHPWPLPFIPSSNPLVFRRAEKFIFLIAISPVFRCPPILPLKKAEWSVRINGPGLQVALHDAELVFDLCQAMALAGGLLCVHGQPDVAIF